jgi:ABC-type glutathione transport system ATPase component
VRIGLQRQLGTAFQFWRSERTLDVLNDRAMELLDQVGLTEFAETVTVNLPYGRKRALEIATTLAMEPELMLLDEPTQGMGHEDVDRVTQLIKKVSAGRTILMVEHNMNVVSSIADKITVLQRGAMLAEGPYAEVSKDPRVMEAYMGTPTPSCRARTDDRERTRAGNQGPARLVRRIAHPARRGPDREPRRGGHAAGPQRRRPHHHAARHHGPDRRAQGLDQGQRQRDHRPAHAQDRALRRRLLPGRARHLLQPVVRGEPDAAAALKAPARA